MKQKLLHEYDGHIQDYYETGMECLGFILQDKRGITPNPDYDPKAKKWPHDVPEWYSLEYALFISHGDELEVYRKDGSVEFRGVLTKDLDALKKHKYELSFIPKEVPLETWLEWMREHRKAKAWSKTAPYAEQKKK